MPKFKCKCFNEASKSHASGNLLTQVLVFIIVFFLIYLAESVIPSILVIPKLLNEVSQDGAVMNGTKELTLKESMRMVSHYTGEAEIMVPMLLCTAFGTLISMFYCRCVEMRPLHSMGFRKKKCLTHYLLGLGIGTLLMTAIVLLSVVTGANSIEKSESINVKVILMFFVGFLIQGMSEEVTFRGYLMTTIGGKNSAAAAIAISSAAFGLAHSMNKGLTVLAMVNLILFGVFAAVYMIYFDDIWGGCAIHSIWNFTQSSLYGISVSGMEKSESVFRTSAVSSHDFLTGGDFGMEGSIFTTIVLAAATFIIVKLQTKKEAASPSGK